MTDQEEENHETSPILQDPETPGRHAVDAPVRHPGLVTDGHREAAVVSSHHSDDVVGGAREGQRAALARVLSAHVGRGTRCKGNS